MKAASFLGLLLSFTFLTGCSTVQKKEYISKPQNVASYRSVSPEPVPSVHSAPQFAAPKATPASTPSFQDEMHAIELDDTWSMRDNSPVLWTEGEVDGNVLRFIVDTGSEMTLVNAQAVRRFGYNPEPTGNAILFPFLGGRSDESKVTLRDFSIGPQSFSNHDMWCVDMPDNIPGEDIGGILGMDLLTPMQVSVSFPHAKLFFGRAMADELERSAKDNHFQSVQVQVEDMDQNDGQRLWLPGSMNGKPIRLMLDTGSRTSFLGPDVLLRVGGIRIKNMPAAGSTDLLRLDDYAPIRVKLGGIDLPASDFCVQRLPDLGPVPYDGVIGTEVLMKLDAILNLPGRSLFLHDPYMKGLALN